MRMLLSCFAGSLLSSMPPTCLWTAEGSGRGLAFRLRLRLGLRTPWRHSSQSLIIIPLVLACAAGVLLARLHPYAQQQMPYSGAAAEPGVFCYLSHRCNIFKDPRSLKCGRSAPMKSSHRQKHVSCRSSLAQARLGYKSSMCSHEVRSNERTA